MPQVMVKLERLGVERSIVGLVIPAGYSFNLDGSAIYQAMAVVFIAQATNTPLTITDQLVLLGGAELTSKGVAGVAGAALVVLAGTLSAAGRVPVAGVVLVLGHPPLHGSGDGRHQHDRQQRGDDRDRQATAARSTRRSCATSWPAWTSVLGWSPGRLPA